MEHLPQHPHAFLAENVVINVAIFAEHDEQLINFICQENGGEQYLCCCKLGMDSPMGWTWDGKTFVEPLEPEFTIEEVNAIQNGINN